MRQLISVAMASSIVSVLVGAPPVPAAEGHANVGKRGIIVVGGKQMLNPQPLPPRERLRRLTPRPKPVPGPDPADTSARVGALIYLSS